MVRNGLALLGGVVVAFVVISAIQYVNTRLHPLPPGFDSNDAQAVAALFAELPLLALLMVELSYAMGSFAGGTMIGWFAASRASVLALALGLLLTVGNVYNLVALPHPPWLAVLTTVTFVPLTWLGARAVRHG